MIMRKILIPTDFSENSMNATRCALELFKYDKSPTASSGLFSSIGGFEFDLMTRIAKEEYPMSNIVILKINVFQRGLLFFLLPGLDCTRGK